MKPVLLFGPQGASDEVEALTKAQVKGYTRKDGTYVNPHTTSRPAAAHKPTASRANRSASQPKGAHPKTKAHMESMIVSANQDGRKFGKKSHYIGMHEQEVGGRKIGVTSHSGKEYKQSWTLDGKTVGPEKVQAHLDQHFSGKADYDHPHVVGRPSKLTNYQWTKETGSRPIAHTGKPTDAHEITFAGRNYMNTGKEGKSAHDGTPVRAFDEGEDGHRVWLDDQGRVHADSIDEVKNLRKRHEEHSAQQDKR